jgi:hypothetical protein
MQIASKHGAPRLLGLTGEKPLSLCALRRKRAIPCRAKGNLRIGWISSPAPLPRNVVVSRRRAVLAGQTGRKNWW